MFKTGTAQDGTFTYTDGGSPATISPALVKQSNTVVVSFVPNAAFTATLKPNGGSSVTYTFLAV